MSDLQEHIQRAKAQGWYCQGMRGDDMPHHKGVTVFVFIPPGKADVSILESMVVWKHITGPNTMTIDEAWEQAAKDGIFDE